MTRFIYSDETQNRPLQCKRLHSAVLEAQLKFQAPKRIAYGGGCGYPHITDLKFDDITLEQYESEYGISYN